MIYNGETNNQDLYSDTRFLIGVSSTDTTTFPLVDFTRSANFALDKVVSVIFRADNRWEFDDSNSTDLPIATASLVANQQDYGIAVTHLKILKVRVKDQQGEWVSLNPINRRDLTDSQLTATAGDPVNYDIIGNSIFVYPKPSYSSTGGLELQYQRGGSYFITTDTTKTPGFASQFHRLISLYAALDYCETNTMSQRVTIIQNKITLLENELVVFYSSRDMDSKISLRPQANDYGQSALGGGANNPDGFNF